MKKKLPIAPVRANGARHVRGPRRPRWSTLPPGATGCGSATAITVWSSGLPSSGAMKRFVAVDRRRDRIGVRPIVDARRDVDAAAIRPRAGSGRPCRRARARACRSSDRRARRSSRDGTAARSTAVAVMLRQVMASDPVIVARRRIEPGVDRVAGVARRARRVHGAGRGRLCGSDRREQQRARQRRAERATSREMLHRFGGRAAAARLCPYAVHERSRRRGPMRRPRHAADRRTGGL